MKLQTIAARAALLVACAAPLGALAQDVSHYVEQEKLVRAGKSVSAFGPDLFGDRVSNYTGSLEFVQTDIALRGNDALPMNVGRRLVTGRGGLYSGHFGEWDLELPSINGVFAVGSALYGQNLGFAVDWPGAAAYQRCSHFGEPPTGYPNKGLSIWMADEYWAGTSMHIPGAGGQEILIRSPANTAAPSDGQTYPLVTKAGWQIRCLPSLHAGNVQTTGYIQGEGFVAVSPEGVQYRFDWMVSRGVLSTTKNLATGLDRLFRAEFLIFPTQITDRHGNKVTYEFNPAAPWQLQRMVASDGRVLTFTYVSGSNRIATASDGTRTWRYVYSSPTGSPTLTQVIQPDNSSWQFALHPLWGGVSYSNNPTCSNAGTLLEAPATGTVTHPSGAIGSFTTRSVHHGRKVATVCINPNGTPNGSYTFYPRHFATRSLVTKTIGGPGLPGMSWNYAYGPANGSDTGCTSCPDTKTVTVTDPRGVTTRSTYGIRVNVNEGQLLQLDEGWNGSSALRTTTTRYRAFNAGPYPAGVGSGINPRIDALSGQYLTPPDRRVITQQGVNFTWEATGFDTFARPTAITRASSLGSSRTETTLYADNTTKWVMGQVANQTVNGTIAASTSYDSVTAMPTAKYQFGKLQATYVFNANGTLAAVTDGAGRTTTLRGYKRGIPQTVLYADGKNHSAVVSNIGLVTSLTNEANTTSSYGYDAMGRLSSITPPGGDPVAYNPTTLVFQQVATAELGLGANHWRQTITTGTAVTINYFDALWRKRISTTSDTAVSGTTSAELLNYDADSRVLSRSYPTASVSPITASLPGTSTVYDNLGRPVSHRSDSDQGVLQSSIDYLSGFTRRTTDNKGNVSTAGFQVFDQPSESALVSVTAPQGLNLSISRDAFGKALSITRSGTNAGLTTNVTRSYVYDGYQRLCKTIEPEIGATLQDWDAAGNLAWRTGGTTLTANTCDPSVAQAKRITFGYDARNRLTSTTYGDGSPGITRTYTNDGLPLQTTSNGSTWTRTYNNRRLTKSETLALGGNTYPISWSYDANGNVVQLTYPDNTSVAYNPNALGQPRQVGSYASAITHLPPGAVGAFTYGNGIAHSLTLNTRGLPLQMRDAGIVQDQYGYDANDNVTAITDQQQGLSSRTMGYDGLDRLTSANGIWGQAAYTYDVQDNLRTSVVGARSATHGYEAANRLTSVTGTGVSLAYAYDANGNIVNRAGQVYGFDLGNRMTQAAGQSTYAYDGLGLRTAINNVDGTAQVQVYSPSLGKLLYAKNTQASTSPASATYSCPAGQTLSGSNCISSSTTAATLTSYTCPAGYTLSGSTCSLSTQSTTPATATYSCPGGGTLSGTSCISSSSTPATPVYSCPGGYTLSGQTCSGTTTAAASWVWDCKGHGTPTAVAGEVYLSCKTTTFAYQQGDDGTAQCQTIANSYGLMLADSYASTSKIWKCVIGPVMTHSCPAGSTLSGTNCLTPSTVAATVSGYTCSSGTLSGSSCITSSSVAATLTYSCPANVTLSGSSCIQTNTTTTAGTPVYACPSGGTLSGTACVTTSSTGATATYSCPNGGTLSGNACIGAGSPTVASTTRYVYLGDKLIAEDDSVAGVSYSHTDALGSPVARTNGSGALVSRTRFEPYGKVAAGFNPTRPNSIGFTGHVNDANIGLTYMQQRYYDPIAGRFLSVDPVTTDANSGSAFNRYNYANNNPYRYTDPDGQAPDGAVVRQINREFERTQTQGGSSASLQGILGRYVEATGGGGASALNVVQMTSAVVRAQINEGSSPSSSAVAPAAAAALTAGMVGGVPAPPNSPNFVVTPGGTAFPVPTGATGPTPVINPGGNVTGAAFTGGAGGANGQVTTMRIMNPNPSNPTGYIKYENSASPKAQGVSPISGSTVSKTDAHIAIDR